MDGVTQTRDGLRHRRRCLAMDAVYVSDFAGGSPGNSAGAVRSRFDRWRERVANLPSRDPAVAKTCDSDCKCDQCRLHQVLADERIRSPTVREGAIIARAPEAIEPSLTVGLLTRLN